MTRHDGDTRDPLTAARDDFDHEQLKRSLVDVAEQVRDRFGEHNPARVEQLLGALDTAAMALDHLKSETPQRDSAPA